jgi:hypothetical protein
MPECRDALTSVFRILKGRHVGELVDSVEGRELFVRAHDAVRNDFGELMLKPVIDL